MKLEVVTMTPEWAQKILETNNTKNRKIRKDVVEKYAKAIRSGQYKLTHQGIAIGSNNLLLDGQHRLLAIVETGIPVQIAFATGCDPETYDVVDTGCLRKSTDVLGALHVPNTLVACSTIRMHIMYYEHFNKIWQGRLRYPTNTEILDGYKQRPSDVDYAASKASSVWSLFKQLSSKSSIGAFVLLAIDKGYPLQYIEAFLQKLGTGSNLSETSPILRFRSAVSNGILKTRGANMSQVSLACIIKTFNYWNDSVTVKQFKVPSLPPMPTINPYQHNENDHYSEIFE